MERIIQSHGEHLKPVLLYRDDIEKIVEAMREVSSDVELSTEEQRFEDLKEWAEMKRDYFTNMQISAKSPFVSLKLEKNQIWLYIGKDTAESRGVFEKVKRILTDHPPPTAKLMNLSTPAVASGICFGAFVSMAAFVDWMGLTVTAILWLGCVWWGRWAFHERFNRYSVIIPRYRIDAPNFWKRNSDKITVAIISTAVGIVLTLLFKRLVEAH
ncbi:MAG: hypothetical protein HY298_22490 [Verrucomicrobia bacterium]|nr:hypothetical protein [Verrucomicrobiota bacterium]